MASIKTTVRFEGLKELENALLELPKATQGNVLKRAAVAAAADFADHASQLAPRGATRKLSTEIKVQKPKIINPGTAAFAAAMKEGATRAEAAAAARAANQAAGGKGRSVITSVGPTRAAFYGLFQEFGTAHHAAKPFMRPTWDALKGSMLETIATTLREEIDKSVKRLARRAARLAAKMKS
jgi:HK97 gp10 family phage protein